MADPLFQLRASGRRRVLANAVRLASRGKTPRKSNEEYYLPNLDSPGDAALFSSFAPSLPAGSYKIETKQSISNLPNKQPDVVLENKSSSSGAPILQYITVESPQFSFDRSLVNSTYPPQGHSDEPRILPHVVLSDPHLPWAIDITNPNPSGLPTPTSIDENKVPWLALIVFDPDELRLSNDALNEVFPPSPGSPPLQQSPTMALNISIQTLLGAQKTAIPVSPQIDPSELSITCDTILCPWTLFTALIDVDDDVPSSPWPSKEQISLDRYKYLAHVRNVNMVGMEDTTMKSDAGIFSVIVSHRTGPVTQTAAKTVVVHLVSLAGIRENIDPKPSTAPSYTALVSLYSWQYRCLPPAIGDPIPHAMNVLGWAGTQLLRPLYSTLEIIKSAKPQLYARLQNGYSLVRYRLQTGESTVAFNRGPLSPVPVACPPILTGHPPIADGWPSETYHSDSYQIMDSTLGIVDISYSSAWELGRAMAMADRTFTAALVRFRSAVNTAALAAAKREYLESKGCYISRSQVIGDLPDLVSTLFDANLESVTSTADGVYRRWRREEPAAHENLSLTHPAIYKLYQKQVAAQVKLRSSAIPPPPDRPDHLDNDYQFYNETNKPNDVDWAIILTWLLDRLFFINTPAHYLITDPSHLPPSSIRFFYIDQNWLAAHLDGALSIGNALVVDADGGDEVRKQIKAMLKAYLIFGRLPSGVMVQQPTSGFLIRSDIITQFSDLTITSPTVTDPTDPHFGCSEVISVRRLDDGILLVLMDRFAASSSTTQLAVDGMDAKQTIDKVLISLPPHQQRFALSETLTSTSLSLEYKAVYTGISLTSPAPSPWGLLPGIGLQTWSNPPGPTDPPAIYDWTTNLVQVVTLAKLAWEVLKKYMPDSGHTFPEAMPTSAVLGLEFNDPIWQLIFMGGNGDGNGEGTVEMPEMPIVENENGEEEENIGQDSINNLLQERELGNPKDSPKEHKPSRGVTRTTFYHTAASHQPPSEKETRYIRPPHIPTRSNRHGLLTHRRISDPPPPPPTPIPPMIVATDVFANTFPRTSSSGSFSLPTNSPYYIDIILALNPKKLSSLPLSSPPISSTQSIAQSSRPPINFLITSITLIIPTSTPILATTRDLNAPQSSTTPLLNRYDGPGGSMLSNLRFHILTTVIPTPEPSDEGFLKIQLLPRTVSDDVPLSQCGDFGFVLRECWVDDRKGGVEVQVEERYQLREPGGEIIGWFIAEWQFTVNKV